MLPEGKKPEPPKVADGSLVVCFLGKDTYQYMTMREDPGPNTAIGKDIPQFRKKTEAHKF